MNKTESKFHLSYNTSKKFSECFTKLKNTALSREQLNFEDGEVKNIHYGDILVTYGNIVNVEDSETPYINRDIDVNNSDYLKTGDVVIADTAEDEIVGKAIEINNNNNIKVISGLHTYPCRPKIKFAEGFLGYYLNSPSYREQLYRYMQGSKVISINYDQLNKTIIKYPSIKEQEKIVQIFISLDKLISYEKNKKESLIEQKTYISNQIFEQKTVVKNTNNKKYPSWTSIKIKDICEITKAGGTPKADKPEYYNGNINFLSISDITGEGKYVYKTEKTITEKGLNNSSAWLVPSNCIILAMYASYGKVCINKVPMATSQALIALKLKEDYDLEFVYELLSYIDRKEMWKSEVKHGAQPNLTCKIVQDFNVMMPCYEEQKIIAKSLSMIENLITMQNDKIVNLENIKKGLMQQLF